MPEMQSHMGFRLPCQTKSSRRMIANLLPLLEVVIPPVAAFFYIRWIGRKA
jgi:hypothetical protein